MRLLLLSMVFIFTTGCMDKNAKPFDVKNLAKSDIDMVADINLKTLRKLSRDLTIKLYKRNPKELQKVQV